MYDVRIINDEAVLFEDDIETSLESYRKNDNIRYEFDDGSCVAISRYNTIIWYDSDCMNHRDGDMPAHISNDGYLSYYKHGVWHKECGPARIWSNGKEYYLDDIEYTKDDFINKLNCKYGIIYMI